MGFTTTVDSRNQKRRLGWQEISRQLVEKISNYGKTFRRAHNIAQRGMMQAFN